MKYFAKTYSILILCLLINFSQNLMAQSIKGSVKDGQGNSLESISIRLKGTNKGVLSNKKGEFQLTVSEGKTILSVSGEGFTNQEKSVTLSKNQNITLDFILKESSKQLQEVTVQGVKAITGMGYLSEVNDNVLYAGKKTEVILLDSLVANTAQNNPRQVLGRVPGANYSETEGSGFPTNGIGFRGLNPSQSIETNTRQNGYNITADLYGYPESYYLPPLEAVERIEVTRGAASLQYGVQFGGVINYILKKGNTQKPIEFVTQQTGGSFNLYNSFNSVGGQIGKFNYYSYIQFQSSGGWRPNSGFQKISGYAGMSYQVSEQLTIGLDYSILRNKIQMPGGFSDEQFQQNSRASYRTRNWLSSPWNVITLSAMYKMTPQTTLSLKNTSNVSERNLVWRNEDGGPATLDAIDPLTNDYINREVQREKFLSNTTEIRLLSNYQIGKTKNTLAAGVRFFTGKMKRQGGGLGTTGSDFDLTLLDPRYEYDLDFTTTNIAPFVENTFRLSDKFTITPGFRYEYINSTVKGYNPNSDKSGEVVSNRSKNRNIFLAGLGLQYKTNALTNFYANISQAYRPTDYSNLTPFGSIVSVDANLKDATGYNADFGFRGAVKNYLNFDIGGFYLAYNNRIGIIEKTDSQGNSFPFRTNIANSIHKGLESYIEFNPVKAFSKNTHWTFSFFNSLALIDAKYVTGEFNGKQVEYAPKFINRLGITFGVGSFTTTYLVSSTAKSYGDASNTEVASADAVAGVIPAYTVSDWSGVYKIKNVNLKFGVNNLSDLRYFTKRTDEYPGPGIIPSQGRSFYLGIGAKF